ncbi:MAG: ATP-binding protein [Cellulosilyticum sp.]|nr:ATP-binding protein [Cellulosilyticum sp.]
MVRKYPISIKKGIVIEEHLNAMLTMQGDRKRIKQLLVILIDNAIKYMGREGSITVQLDKKNKFMTREEEIILTVNDTGQGIEEEKLDKLFERFYRGDLARSQEGSGLGLAIAKWIVESHQGKIRVESRLGEGTSFIIELPTKLKKEKTKFKNS